MPIKESIQLISRHPLNAGRPFRTWARVFSWQLKCRLSPGRHIIPWVNDSQLYVRRGETGLTGNVYCGLHEFHEMSLVLHALRPGELFVDVGANAGAYTVLAGRCCKAKCIAVEPVPETYDRLRANVKLNNLTEHVSALNIGLAEKEGSLLFTAALDCVNHVATEVEAKESCVNISVATLDDVLAGQSPRLIKIDVEGYEFPILEGAGKTLACPDLAAIIVETNQSGRRYGFPDQNILDKLKDFGFIAARYEPVSRQLTPAGDNVQLGGNSLFVRDLPGFALLLKAGQPFELNGRKI